MSARTAPWACADRLEKQTAKCELVGVTVTGWFEAATTIATT
jgi:hypothetical protein